MGLLFALMEPVGLHDYVLEQLEASKGRWSEVADGSGVPKRTLEKIARREIVDPGVSHIEKLATWFRARESDGARQAAA